MAVYINHAADPTVGLAPENLPDELKTYAHWVVWKAVPKKGSNKLDKIPYDPKIGVPASHSDSRTWTTFAEALEAYEEEARRWDGVGFVFSSGDPFVGLDFDGCRNPETGEVDPEVLAYINRFEHGYAEASISGTGVHLIARGHLVGGKRKGEIEIYGSHRFFALTGVLLNV